MAGFSTYAENKSLMHSLGQAVWTMPTAVYVALLATDPTDAGIITSEISGNNYSRVNVTALFGTAVDGTISNTSEILFPTPSGDWGDVAFCVIIDNLGNVIYNNPLSNPVFVYSGDEFKFKIGKFIINQD